MAEADTLHPPAPETPAERRMRTVRVSDARVRLAEHVRQHFHLTPDEGTSMQRMLEPDYWAHVAKRMQRLDLIDVVPEDGSYFAQFMVRSTAPQAVKVALIQFREFEQMEERTIPEGFAIVHRGSVRKWAVAKKAASGKLEYQQDGFNDEAAAFAWLAEKHKTLT